MAKPWWQRTTLLEQPECEQGTGMVWLGSDWRVWFMPDAESSVLNVPGNQSRWELRKAIKVSNQETVSVGVNRDFQKNPSSAGAFFFFPQNFPGIPELRVIDNISVVSRQRSRAITQS